MCGERLGMVTKGERLATPNLTFSASASVCAHVRVYRAIAAIAASHACTHALPLGPTTSPRFAAGMACQWSRHC